VLNDKSWIHDNIAKEAAKLDFSGKYIRFPVTVQRELGGGSRTDGGVLPQASAAVDVEARALMQNHYYALEWTEIVEEVSKNEEGAFENVVSRKMKTVATDMAKGLNRQWYNPLIGAVESGLATTSGASTVTTSTAKYPQYVRVGDTLDVVTLSTGAAVTNGTGRVVQSISSAGVITFGGTGDPGGNLAVTAGTHGLVITGNYGNEVVGLRGFGETGRTLHNVNSSTYPSWDGNKFNVSGAVAGESAFEQLYDRVGERGRGDVDTFIFTRGIRRRLADEFASQRRLPEREGDRHQGGLPHHRARGRRRVRRGRRGRRLPEGLRVRVQARRAEAHAADQAGLPARGRQRPRPHRAQGPHGRRPEGGRLPGVVPLPRLDGLHRPGPRGHDPRRRGRHPSTVAA
jgi:hypothetical protein